MSSEAFLFAAVYLVGINAASVAAFAWDKHRAREGEWRIKERTLLTMAAAGGSVGALVASHRLRHKTYKEPFRTILRLIAGVQVVGVVALAVFLIWRLTGAPGQGS